jgi:Uri superfamily endonuclease
VIYALLSDGEPVYVGSTVKGAEARVRVHRRQKKEIASWNAALAELLAKGKPEYQELAVVPDAERLQLEAEMIKRLGARHKLMNKFHNGYRHSPETRSKISAGVRRYYSSRAGFSPCHHGNIQPG